MADTDRRDGAVRGGVRTLLRIEGAALFGLATGAYLWVGGEWWLFLILFLAPDLSFLAYAAGPRAGAVAYNAVHMTLLPIVLLAIGIAGAVPLAVPVALIWAAHVGIDRALGYGLKYASAFGATHLGRVGKR